MSPTGSPPAAVRGVTSTSAPIRSRTSSRPVRVGFTPTPRSTISEPGTSVAAAMKNAAEEKSPGTSTSPSSMRRMPDTDMRPPSLRTSTPAARSITSVWSRDGRCSTTVVSLSASRPASSTHDFTCALATGSSYSIPCRSAPSTTIGGKPPSRKSTLAPMRRSGCATRSTGRRRMLSSPSRRPGPARLPGEPSRQDPQQGARVADVDRLRAGVGPAQAGAHELEVGARTARLCAGETRSQLGDRLQRRGGVRGAQVAAHLHAPVGHRADDRGAVRDRLVGRRRQLALQRGAGSKRTVSLRCPPARPSSRARRSARSARSALPSPAIQSAIAPDLMSGPDREPCPRC